MLFFLLQFGKPNNILLKGREFTAKYGPARLVRIGLFKPVVVLAGAEYIKPVLTTASRDHFIFGVCVCVCVCVCVEAD